MTTLKGAVFMLWDTHMHTYFSGDSDADPAAMVHSAIAKNLAGICITDHLDYDYPDEPDLFTIDFVQYKKEICQLQADFSDSIKINHGIELGLQPHLAKRHHDLLQAEDFDFVIGSSHVVHGIDPYYPEYYEERTEEAAYREYFESILENIAAFDEFDVYGHIDYVVRYGPNKNTDYSYEKFKDVIDEILRQLIARRKGIELNMAGFKYGLGHPNPTEEILHRYRELGGEIITVGADGHAPDQIAWDFEKVPGILKSAGFDYFTVFTKRKPEFIPVC